MKVLTIQFPNNLFNEKVIRELNSQDLYGKTLLQFLGWSSSKDKQFRTNAVKINPNAEGLLRHDEPINPVSSSPIQKNTYPSSTPIAVSFRTPARSRSRSSTKWSLTGRVQLKLTFLFVERPMNKLQYTDYRLLRCKYPK